MSDNCFDCCQFDVKGGILNILKFFRLIFRGVVILLWTLFVHNFFVDIPRLFTKKRRFPMAVHIWGTGLAWLMGIRIHRINEMPSEPGTVIVSNHLGFIDVPILSSVFVAVYMIKAEVKKAFYFGPALARGGHFFVEREKATSLRQAAKALLNFKKDFCDIIIFPEGKASPDAQRLPFKIGAFATAKKLNKKIQPCVIDYLPDRQLLKWDVNRKMLPQLMDLFGKRKIDVSIEFFPPEYVDDPRESAEKWHDIMEEKLKAYDMERGNDTV